MLTTGTIEATSETCIRRVRPRPKIPVRERISPLRTQMRALPKVTWRKPASMIKWLNPKTMKKKIGACFWDTRKATPVHTNKIRNSISARLGLRKTGK